MKNDNRSTRLPGGLPIHVENVLMHVAEVCKEAFAQDLCAILLFGSAAEGKLRATSDLNLLFVLNRYERQAIDRVRDALQAAQAAVRLRAMFVLEPELSEAGEAFAVKFLDIARRHFVLFGRDVLQSFQPSRPALVRRTEQLLINLILRLRERYVMVSLQEEQLAVVVAEAASPLRSAAAAICELEGQAAASPKEALRIAAGGLPGEGWSEALRMMSQARETGALPPGKGAEALHSMIALSQGLLARLRGL